MKKLEDKIINKIYKYETKRTIGEIVGRASMFLFFGFSGYVFVSLLFDIYKQAGSLDLLDFFYSDNLFVFFEETPKIILFFSISFIMIVLYKLISFVRNFQGIKNKLKSIISYWKKNI